MQFAKTLFTTTLLFFFGNLLFLNAQENFTPLFKKSITQSRNNFRTDQPDTKRINYLELNNLGRNGLKNLPSNLQLNLFPDVAIDVHLEKSTKTFYKNMEVYRGRSQDRRFAHLRHYRDVIIIYNPNTQKITAQIATNQGAFEISPTANAHQYKVSEWEDKEINCQNFYEKATQQHQHIHESAGRSGCNEQDADGKYVADLFVGYSYEASVRANDIDAHALSLVEMVNNGLTNSLVNNIYIRLVGTAISEHNPGVVTSVLGNVYNWFSDEIALTGADYVASIQVPTGGPSEAGGWAGVGGYSSVNSINGAAAVFRHELGHNIGSSHCNPGILPYAAGFDNGNVKTHMCGNNINFYSTPLVNDAEGTPIGHVDTADNARVWRERAATVSNRRKHTILFDANDTGCGNPALANGRYYIQNINSNQYLATENGSNSNGSAITQAANQASSNQWDLIGVTPNAFRIIHVASGRYVDVPGGSGSAGTNMILWNAHGGANQVFTIDEIDSGVFTIKANNGQCLQIEAAGQTEGDPIEQNNCDNSTNTRWRFIPVPNGSVLSLSVATTNVTCFGNTNGSATASATGGTGNYSYTWSTGATGATVNNLPAGNYSVTIDDGTTNFPYAFSIKQIAPFMVTLTKQQTTNLAAKNASATVTVSGGTAPYTYAWDNGSTTNTANDLTAGLHKVIITDANGCILEKEFFIDCPETLQACDDGNPNTYGDHIDRECNCIGKVITCPNGLAVSNVVIGKTATQSSTSGSADANRAIDGNLDGNFNNGSVAATQGIEDFNAWWQVDLRDNIDINQILISNRTDCCTGRLEDYQVFISTAPFTSDDLETTRNQTGIVWTQIYENATPLPDTLIEPNATGRYVRIQSLSDRGLNLAEVGVFSCGVPLSQAITANPLGNNDYELKGIVINNGATVTGVTVEHGANNFANSQSINISGANSQDTFYVNTVVNIGSATNYQFRISFTAANKTYYSNAYTFTNKTAYCTPSVDNDFFYKEFRKVALNGKNYDGNGDNYEDATTFSFGTLTMGSTYTLQGTTPTSGWTNLSYLVYIDLNNDGDFTDYNEIVGTSTPKGQATSFEITIPTEDVLVNRALRMRILGHEGGAFTTCYSPVGNYKDFKIQIAPNGCVKSGYLVPFYVDADKDGFGNANQEIARNCSVAAVNGYVKINGDCDDTRPTVHPQAVEICGDGIDNNCDGVIDFGNVVLNKITKQSSNSADGISSRAVDGNTNGAYASGSTTHTASEENPWWEVDLGTNVTLDSIRLWNRTDCCSDRLTNFYVFLSATPFSSDNPTVLAGQTGVWSKFTTTLSASSILFNPNTSGRYLRVQIAGTGILSLAEVQAFSSCSTENTCTFYRDADGDGYGNPAITQQSNCNSIPAGFVANNQDFDDTESTAFNGAVEICDNIDNNGNGQIDEGASYDETNRTFQNETLPTKVYTASQTISTNQIVNVGNKTDVRMIAGQSITLNAGFSVATGSQFLAKIVAGCTVNLQESEIATTHKSSEKEESPLTESVALSKDIEYTAIADNVTSLKIMPNPFRERAKVVFSLGKTTPVSLKVYGMNGQLVATVLDGAVRSAGDYTVNFSAVSGMRGMYYFVLMTEDGVFSSKVIVMNN